MFGQVGTNRSSHPKADDIECALRAAGTARGKYQAPRCEWHADSRPRALGTAVTPHASFLALDVDPQDAFANIQALRSRYNIYDRYGFFDAVNPVTGQVGHRYLVLDQSMIMAALDNALRGRAMQQHFAPDPVIAAARPYLSEESFSIP